MLRKLSITKTNQVHGMVMTNSLMTINLKPSKKRMIISKDSKTFTTAIRIYSNNIKCKNNEIYTYYMGSPHGRILLGLF